MERPKLIPNTGDQAQAEAFDQFAKLAAARPNDTVRVSDQIYAGEFQSDKASEEDREIADAISRVLDTSRDGIYVNFDNDTWDVFMNLPAYASSSAEIKGSKSRDEERQMRRRLMAKGLGVYAIQAQQYKITRKGGRVA